MAISDYFVIYDSVQYTKNDWRNRNIIATHTGPVWLTIPVTTSGRSNQKINEALISDHRWAKKHWATIEQAFARRPFFGQFKTEWERWYQDAGAKESLHDVNMVFLTKMATLLGISIPLIDDRDFQLEPDTPTGKLVQLCEAVGADRYVTGPAGLNYLEQSRFRDSGIALDVIDYSQYPAYEQTQQQFMHDVSALDLLASVGDEAANHLLGCLMTVELSSESEP